jgi:hypothetical protein
MATLGRGSDRASVASQSFRDNGTGSVGLNVTTRRSPAPEVRRDSGAGYKTTMAREMFRFQQLQPRFRCSHHPRAIGVIVRAVPHIDAEICTVEAVSHVRQGGPLAAQAIRPVIGAGLVTHFDAFEERNLDPLAWPGAKWPSIFLSCPLGDPCGNHAVSQWTPRAIGTKRIARLLVGA